uniref:Uncharacterized protein n=1 Tax=Lactuca sativa TaxID=4236 RepID=A0A9R1XNM3_LACSA|nr:hypothetical protein LSAT_V11C200068720 [Lactuca sativa]
MDALAIKEEKCKVLETKLHYAQYQVDDLIAKKAVTRSCISDVTGLLSDIIETHDPIISITVKKHLSEMLRLVFAMLHCLEADVCSETRGEGSSKVQTNEPPKDPIKPPVIKQEPKKKEKLLSEEPIIDDSEDEEPDEVELKRQKAREADTDEHARIVREAEEKERVEKEAQATLKSKMILFPKWTLKRMQNQVMDMPSQYWLDPIASFEIQNTQDSQLDLPITPKAFRFLGMMDVEIATVLRQKPSIVPKEAPTDFEKLNPGKNFKEGWFVCRSESRTKWLWSQLTQRGKLLKI